MVVTWSSFDQFVRGIVVYYALIFWYVAVDLKIVLSEVFKECNNNIKLNCVITTSVLFASFLLIKIGSEVEMWKLNEMNQNLKVECDESDTKISNNSINRNS